MSGRIRKRWSSKAGGNHAYMQEGRNGTAGQDDGGVLGVGQPIGRWPNLEMNLLGGSALANPPLVALVTATF